ncbi:hypothetical protein [Bdellovibrio bacteriovorus]|uniref:hypothetical protein n=1 Tax=Bdellovibrio bacteriovorus TaxID=959 RepID=UPI0035A6D629
MANYRENVPTYIGTPKQRSPSSEVPSTIQSRATSLFNSGKDYAIQHPYQVILGAVGIAGIGALTAYLVNKARH